MNHRATSQLSAYSLVLVTCPTDAAERITSAVLKIRLAACVNVVEIVHSRYWWKGKLESADESLLLIKTKAELFEKLVRAIKRVHPYEVPEIVELQMERGNREYLDWMLKETRPLRKRSVLKT